AVRRFVRSGDVFRGASRALRTHQEQHAAVTADHTVIARPSKVVSEKPRNRSLKHSFMSPRMLSATASPRRRPATASERQWMPDMSRPQEVFQASLFSSPPTVSCGPRYGTSRKPSSVASPGSSLGKDSLQNALSLLAQAPRT